MAKLGMSDRTSIKMFGAKPPELKKPQQKTDSSDEDLDTILVVGPRRKKFFDFLIISMDSTIYHYFTLLMTILTLASSMMYASSAAFRTHVEAKQGQVYTQDMKAHIFTQQQIDNYVWTEMVIEMLFLFDFLAQFCREFEKQDQIQPERDIFKTALRYA